LPELKEKQFTVNDPTRNSWYQNTFYTMIEVIFKIFLTDYIDFQGFITKRKKPLLIEYNRSTVIN